MNRKKICIISIVVGICVLLIAGLGILYAIGKKDGDVSESEEEIQTETEQVESTKVDLPQLDMPEMFQEDLFEQYGTVLQNFNDADVIEKEYDAKNHLVKEVRKNNGDISEVRTYEYNQNGYLVQEKIGYIQNGNEHYADFVSYEYDNNNNVISQLYTNSEGIMLYQIAYPTEGEIAEQTDFGKTYDEHDNVAQELYYYEDWRIYHDELRIIQYAYQYDEQGRIVKEIKNHNGVIEYYQNEYDDNGQLVRRIFVDNERNVVELREFQYSNGTVIKESVKSVIINWEQSASLTGIDEQTYLELVSLFTCDSETYYNNWYTKALTSYYSSPEEIDLYWLFLYGGSGVTASEEEEQYYIDNKIKGEDGYIGELFCINEDIVNAALEKCLGITVSQTKDGLMAFNNLLYYEKTGNYLMNLTEGWDIPILFTGATQLENGDVELYYLFQEQESVVTMRNKNGTWKIVSNQSVNGEEHPYLQSN